MPAVHSFGDCVKKRSMTMTGRDGSMCTLGGTGCGAGHAGLTAGCGTGNAGLTSAVAMTPASLHAIMPAHDRCDRRGGGRYYQSNVSSEFVLLVAGGRSRPMLSPLASRRSAVVTGPS